MNQGTNADTPTMNPALQQAIQQAVAHHQAGQLQEAEHLYRTILAMQPRHPDANHNLGVLAIQMQQPAASLSHFKTALDVNPKSERYWLSYIDALIQAGEIPSARQVLAQAEQHGLHSDALAVLAVRLTDKKSAEPAPPLQTKLSPKRGKPAKTTSHHGAEPNSKEINDLLMLFSQGRHAEMENAARDLTRRFPKYGIGWKALGTALSSQGKCSEALNALQQAIALSRGDAEAHSNLGNALKNLRRFSEAETSYRQALKINPKYAEALSNLGVTLVEQDRSTEAEAVLRRALGIKPNHAEAHNNLGIALMKQERLNEAMPCFRQALEIRPNYYEALNNLGSLFTEQGLLAEGETSCREALKLKPDYAPAHSNLGVCLQQQGRLTESEACFRHALQFNPDSAEALCGLGITLNDLDYLPEAETSLRHALEINPNYIDALSNLGLILERQGRVDEAIASYNRALELDPDNADILNNLGLTLQDQGRLDESIPLMRHALKLKPDHLGAQNNLLFGFNYHPDASAEDVFRVYQDYDSRRGMPLRSTWRPHNNDKNPARRLKIGYLSPDFRQHATRNFLEPLLGWHDKSMVEVYAYAELTKEDDVSIRYRSYVDHWIPTKGMSDEALAQRIRDDGIDILVELAGHTASNRLPVFARKPAPVSLSWLGYGYTTGLSAIDYYLTDAVCAPLGSEALFAEQPWRLENPPYAYRPTVGMGGVGSLPAQKCGYITFGTLTRSIRINHRTIRVWSDILKAVPNSRLVIDSRNFKDPLMQERMAARFMEQGISRERLAIGFNSPPWDTLRSIDIGLDCFPHNSGTTLFETLYMGIPYITLAGRPSVGLLGSCILQGVGHPEWIAESEDDYVVKAVKLADDWSYLASIRAQLRTEMENSPIRDEAGFARKVENAYRQMWQRWCDTPSTN
jgi:predicted O-linked N-acetylglucosamine transferase (SPINDLY family)